jgi:GNAT superfamily N-acetyltransferase
VEFRKRKIRERESRAMEIREVRPHEYEEAGHITALAYREFLPPRPSPGWEEYLASVADVGGRIDRTIVLVAVKDGRILGSATIEMDEVIGDDDDELPADTACLRMLGVDPELRRGGVGRGLVEATIALARARGKREVILRTTPPMTAAQALYESMGFERDPSLDLTFPEVTARGYRLGLGT